MRTTCSARSEYMRGDYTKAEQLRLQALDVYRQRFGEKSLQVAGIENNLAVFYAERGRYSEAEAAGRRAVDIRRALLGVAHPDTLLAMYNLGNALFQRGAWVNAADIFEKVLAGQQRVLGPSHPHTVLTQRQVARILTGFGRYDEASHMLAEAARTTDRTYGDQPAAAGYVKSQLSRLEQLRGRFDESVRLASEVLTSFERSFGPDHVETAWARMNLGDRLIDAGAFDDAERELGRAERTIGAAGGDSDPYYAQTLDLQGLLAARRGRLTEARRLLERALTLFGTATPDKAFDAAPTRLHLAAVLTGPENAARRLQLFREALATLRQSLPPAHAMTTEVLLAYGRFLSGSGRTAEAEPLLREASRHAPAHAWRRQHPHRRSSECPRTLSRLGGQACRGPAADGQRRARPRPVSMANAPRGCRRPILDVPPTVPPAAMSASSRRFRFLS